MFSKTAEEIVRNTQGVPHTKFFAHNLPIPDCFELPLLKALQDPSFTHIWFIEDDMILPDDILRNMLNLMTADVATCDYPVAKNGQGAIYMAKDGELIFGGLGCTLVKREVLDKLNAPYFRTDIKWRPTNYGKTVGLTAYEGKPKGDEYGMQDVNFYMKLHQAGASFELFPQKLGQRKLVRLGRAGTNNGAHETEEWTKLIKNYWPKQIATFPVQPSSKLQTVEFPSGRMNVSKTHAKNLIKEGRAKAVRQPAVIIDANGLVI